MESPDTETITISLPLDAGFLRRACSHCRLEFKWKHTPDALPQAEPYHCPYCGLPGDEWFTEAQVEHLKAAALSSSGISDAFADLQRTMDEFGASDNGFGLRMTLSGDFPMSPPAPLHEPEDMRLVTPVCHPTEPIKVLESWVSPVHCLVCGNIAQSLEPQH